MPFMSICDLSEGLVLSLHSTSSPKNNFKHFEKTLCAVKLPIRGKIKAAFHNSQ